MRLIVTTETLNELLSTQKQDTPSERARLALLAEAREFGRRLVIHPAPTLAPIPTPETLAFD